MATSRRFTHFATVLAVAAAAGVTGVALAGASSASVTPGESCEQVQSPPAHLPEGIESGDLLFVSKYHPVLVKISCGQIELVELTGWDSCYFLHEDAVVRYPC
jgi:hypothetical protein